MIQKVQEGFKVMSHNQSFQDIHSMQEGNQIQKNNAVINPSSFCQVIKDLQEMDVERKKVDLNPQGQEKEDTYLLQLESQEAKDEHMPQNKLENISNQSQQLLLREEPKKNQKIDIENEIERNDDQMKELQCIEVKIAYTESLDDKPVGRSNMNKTKNEFYLPCHRKQIQKIKVKREQMKKQVNVINGQQQQMELAKSKKQQQVNLINQQQKELAQSKKQQQKVKKVEQEKQQQKGQFAIACQRKQAERLKNQSKKMKNHSQNDLSLKSVQKQNQSLFEEKKKKGTNLKFQQFMKKCSLQTFKCQNGNNAKKVCATNKCKSSAFICNKDQCKKCSNSHKQCYVKLEVKMFAEILKRNLLRQKDIERQIFEFQQQVLDKIQENRLKAIKYLAFQGLNSKWQEKMKEGKQSLNHQIDLNGSQVIECFSQFQKEEKYDSQRLSFIKSRLGQFKKNIFSLCEKSNRMLLESFSNSLLTTLSSKLVSKKSSTKFILNNLDYPQELKLLYRASENEFSLQRYHQSCNNIQNTLTIIKTEHNKLIGAYTPLELNDHVGFDRKNKTFLMAIDLQQRMEQVHRGECAVYYSQELGPCFGGLFDQRDVEVYSENGNLYCQTNFPSAFNWKNYFKSSQESWHFLTGVNEGNKCRVVDFEVFRVEFRK